MAKKKYVFVACTTAEAERIEEIARKALHDRTKTPLECFAIRQSVTRISPTYIRIEGDKATVDYMMNAIKAL